MPSRSGSFISRELAACGTMPPRSSLTGSSRRLRRFPPNRHRQAGSRAGRSFPLLTQIPLVTRLQLLTLPRSAVDSTRAWRSSARGGRAALGDRLRPSRDERGCALVNELAAQPSRWRSNVRRSPDRRPCQASREVGGARPRRRASSRLAPTMTDGSCNDDHVERSVSMHHWADPTVGLAEIGRVLRTEGRVLVWDFRAG